MREVQGGGGRCRDVQGGAEMSREVLGGAEMSREVQGGGEEPQPTCCMLPGLRASRPVYRKSRVSPRPRADMEGSTMSCSRPGGPELGVKYIKYIN